MYFGPKPFGALYTSSTILKSIIRQTGSQCKDMRTGVMWSTSYGEHWVKAVKMNILKDFTYQHILSGWWTESAVCSGFSTGCGEFSLYLRMRGHLAVKTFTSCVRMVNADMKNLPIRPFCLQSTFLSSSLWALRSLFHSSSASMFRLLLKEAQKAGSGGPSSLASRATLQLHRTNIASAAPRRGLTLLLASPAKLAANGRLNLAKQSALLAHLAWVMLSRRRL